MIIVGNTKDLWQTYPITTTYYSSPTKNGYHNNSDSHM